MAFLHGKATRVMVGLADLSPYFTSVEADASATSHDVTTLSKTTVQRAAGLKDGKVSMTGLFDATCDALVAAYLGSAAGEVVTICPGGDTAGGPAQLGTVSHTSYKTSQPVGGMVAASATLDCKTAWEPNGKVLHVLGAETATGNEASVDNAASTANGGIASIHCTVFTGTSLAVKIQHSTNDTDWVDLTPAFTSRTAVGSEQIVIAAGTTVNRYLREYHTIVGTTMTYLVAFARR